MPWYLFYLWLAPIPLGILLLVLMVRRELHRQYPFFFVYNIYAVVSAATLFYVYYAAKHWQLAYFTWETYGYGYFVDQAVYTGLRFGVVYEVFQRLFASYPALQRLGQPVFRSAMLVLLAVALGFAALTRGHDAYFSNYALHVLEQTASILQLGLLMVLFLFSAFAGLSWRNFVFGIGLGLGIYASIKLAMAALQAATVLQSGSKYANAAVMAGFHLAVLIWLFYLLIPDRTSTEAPNGNIDGWRAGLQGLS
ncbi:MAG TPA: hypothetical protein VF753_16805 [Terriglobales bacterium]